MKIFKLFSKINIKVSIIYIVNINNYITQYIIKFKILYKSFLCKDYFFMYYLILIYKLIYYNIL